MPTGKESSVLVLDVDGDEGRDSLAELEEKHSSLPITTTVRTGSGGTHYYFKYPDDIEIRNSSGRLGRGLDIRGEGGYVLVPGSATEQPYEFTKRGPAAPAPAWLIKLLSPAPSNSEARKKIPRGTLLWDSDKPILDGERNDTLARIAGRLHDGRSLEELEAALIDVNAQKCSPPLPEDEVRRIAESIFRYEPCSAGPAPSTEALRDLDEIERILWCTRWEGIGGKGERDIMVSLIKQGRSVGHPHPEGVEVSIGTRQLALLSALSKRSVFRALNRLKDSGWLMRTSRGSDTHSGTIVLRRAKWHHSTTLEVSKEENSNSIRGGDTLRAPFSAPRLRWSAPRFDRVGDEVVRTTIIRLGKTAGAIIDYLEKVGGSATLEEVADFLQVKRTRDLKRRVISRLETASVVECSGDIVVLAGDWLEALSVEREATGEIDAKRRDMARYAREREAYRNREKTKPEYHHANVRADGYVGDLRLADSKSGEDVNPASEQPKLSDIAKAVRDYLEKNPCHACQPPGWIGTTLWACDLYPGKPTPIEVRAAIEELGGETYLRDNLRQSGAA